jgi:hypothetical protein
MDQCIHSGPCDLITSLEATPPNMAALGIDVSPAHELWGYIWGPIKLPKLTQSSFPLVTLLARHANTCLSRSLLWVSVQVCYE